MKYKHIIWDWNGTLLNDTQLCILIINGLLESQGKPPLTTSRYRSIFGFPVIEYYQEAGFDFSVTPFETLSTQFIEAYERGREFCQLMPGAQETLSSLDQTGYTQSVLSASKQDYLEKAVADHQLQEWFNSLNGLNNHHAHGKLESGKDHLKQDHLNPETTLMVGDTLHDAFVASSLGIDCLLVPNGHQNLERLATAQVPVARDLSEVIAFLANTTYH